MSVTILLLCANITPFLLHALSRKKVNYMQSIGLEEGNFTPVPLQFSSPNYMACDSTGTQWHIIVSTKLFKHHVFKAYDRNNGKAKPLSVLVAALRLPVKCVNVMLCFNSHEKRMIVYAGMAIIKGNFTGNNWNNITGGSEIIILQLPPLACTINTMCACEIFGQLTSSQINGGFWYTF